MDTLGHMNWNYPTSIRFGAGRIKELPQICLDLGMKNPLLITDQSLGQLSITQTALDACEVAKLPCGLFTDIQPNPIEENVTAGVIAYHEGKHDGVIAFGGGSALDGAKAIALMVGQNRPLWDFEDKEDWYTRVNVSGMAPVVAVPTTSGTGSEVGRCSVITDIRDETKKIIFHPKMLPSVVILDPLLTIGLPAKITAAVGMDALSHNLEAYFSPLYHPMADGISIEGAKLAQRYLLRAVNNGSDVEARAQLLVASTMGATAFQKGLGAMHSVSHPCGAILHTHHGLTNAVMMPYVLEFNRKYIADKAIELASALHLKSHSLSAVIDWTLELRESIGIPHTLAELGVTDEYIERLTKGALVDPTASTNPRKLEYDNVSTLIEHAIVGDLVIKH